MFGSGRDKPKRNAVSIGRDADPWRSQMLLDDLAEKSAARRHAQNMRRAVVAGVVLGVLASVVQYF